jgi:hypothetical protein
MKFVRLFGEFQDVFAWYYEDICGFDPALLQHVIPIKEGIKPVRKKQRPINPALEATIRKELEKLLKAGIIFLIKYYEWVSNHCFRLEKNWSDHIMHIFSCIESG